MAVTVKIDFISVKTFLYRNKGKGLTVRTQALLTTTLHAEQPDTIPMTHAKQDVEIFTNVKINHINSSLQNRLIVSYKATCYNLNMMAYL